MSDDNAMLRHITRLTKVFNQILVSLKDKPFFMNKCS